MTKPTPFLWFDNNAEDAANFYLGLFPNARKTNELRSKGVGPWPAGHIATIAIDIDGQGMTFMNGGPGHPQTDAFSFVILCDSQEELDSFWEKILAGGGSELACGWIKDAFGVHWQFMPREMFELIKHPKGMAAMMTMKKIDIAKLREAARE